MQLDWRGLLATIFFIFTAGKILASENTEKICEKITQRASQKANVPHKTLHTALREKMVPEPMKPWHRTVKIENIRLRLETEGQARSHALNYFNLDAGSFDLEYVKTILFGSITDVLRTVIDPRYAISIRHRFYIEFGDWAIAVPEYHSRTQKPEIRSAARYAKNQNTLFSLNSGG
jgi:hypothetical protein